MREVHFYTDGSCLQNPNGPGGWAVIIVHPEDQVSPDADIGHYYFGGEVSTTNNRMELVAVIEALDMWKPRNPEFKSAKLHIFTDSKYVCDGVTSWLPNWLKNNWRTAAGKPVKNKDLWLKLHELLQRHGDVVFRWVKGHADNQYNNAADRLARSEAERIRREVLNV